MYSSGKTEHLLELILDEMRSINAKLNHRGPVPTPPVLTNACSRCRLNLEGSMGYVCADPACPTRHGIVMAQVS